MLVENKFVFVKIPKNASTSVQNSFFLHNIKVDQGDAEINKRNELNIDRVKNRLENSTGDIANYHQHIIELYDKFPKEKYQYIGIKRDSTDRFISAFKYILYKIKYKNYKSKVDFFKFNENDLIEYFTPIFQNHPYKNSNHMEYDENIHNIVREFFCEDDEFVKKSSWIMLVKNFQSQYFWGVNELDYIFDFNNLHIFEEFISKSLNKEFYLVHDNSSKSIDSKIKKTDKIEEFVYKFIDSPFLDKKLI